MSIHEAIADFISFMEANGVRPAEPISQRLTSGELIRFRCEGDGKGRKNGWAILYLDERPAGAFGNYRLNTGRRTWKQQGAGRGLTKEERAAMQREWQAAREKREAERHSSHLEAAIEAAEIWQRARPVIAHPYLETKGIEGTGLRVDNGTLLVPMFDVDGKLWNLQRIKPDGEKRFMYGGRVDDLFHLLGKVDRLGKQAVLCEGYATGETVFDALGHPVIVAFNTSNLPRVARIWARLRPDLRFTVFADDDEATALKEQKRTGIYKNPGIAAARATANEIGAAVAYPLGRPQGEGM